jgi:molybdopterin molybdotransferase
VLARDVISDVDLPPFDKSAMDGFAVHSADFAP